MAWPSPTSLTLDHTLDSPKTTPFLSPNPQTVTLHYLQLNWGPQVTSDLKFDSNFLTSTFNVQLDIQPSHLYSSHPLTLTCNPFVTPNMTL